jgi:hypothetical protein
MGKWLGSSGLRLEAQASGHPEPYPKHVARASRNDREFLAVPFDPVDRRVGQGSEARGLRIDRPLESRRLDE